MSVFMMLQVEGDPARLADVMSDAGLWQTINARAKENGAIHHRFFASADGGTIAVFDEWESEEGFRTFFSSSPEIPQMMQAAGVTSEPRVAFWHPLDTPDQF
jgi:hypothetical protein